MAAEEDSAISRCYLRTGLVKRESGSWVPDQTGMYEFSVGGRRCVLSAPCYSCSVA